MVGSPSCVRPESGVQRGRSSSHCVQFGVEAISRSYKTRGTVSSMQSASFASFSSESRKKCDSKREKCRSTADFRRTSLSFRLSLRKKLHSPPISGLPVGRCVLDRHSTSTLQRCVADLHGVCAGRCKGVLSPLLLYRPCPVRFLFSTGRSVVRRTGLQRRV